MDAMRPDPITITIADAQPSPASGRTRACFRGPLTRLSERPDVDAAEAELAAAQGPEAELDALLRVAMMSEYRNPARTLELLPRARALAATLHSPIDHAWADLCECFAHYNLGLAFDHASRSARVVAIAREHRDSMLYVYAMNWAAAADLWDRRLAHAALKYDAVLRELRHRPNERLECGVLGNLANVFDSLDLHVEAIKLDEYVCDVYARAGSDPNRLAYVQSSLVLHLDHYARELAVQGDADGARRTAQRGLEVAQACAPWLTPQHMPGLGIKLMLVQASLALTLGEIERARALVEQVNVAQGQSAAHAEQRAAIEGLLRLAEGDIPAAILALERAEPLMQRGFASTISLDVLHALADAYARAGRWPEAMQAMRRYATAQVRLRVERAEQHALLAKLRAETVHEESIGFLSHDVRGAIWSAKLLLEQHGALSSHGPLMQAHDILGGAADMLDSFTLYASADLLSAAAAVEVDLDDAIAQAIHVAEPAAIARQVTIRFELDEAVLVRNHPTPLIRALYNLLHNAIKFAPTGTAVDIDVVTTHDEIAITIRDGGPGFEPAQLVRPVVVAPKLDASLAGFGLGLLYVARFATAVGGRLDIDNHPQGGACVTLVLPRAPEGAASTSPA